MPQTTDIEERIPEQAHGSASDDQSDPHDAPAPEKPKPGEYAREVGLSPGLAVVLIAGVMALIYGAVGLGVVGTFP